MPFDDERGGFSSGRDGKTDRPVRGLDLHHEGAEHVDAKAVPALAVLRVAAHRGGDVIVDPVPTRLIVIIGAAAPEHECAHLSDRGKSHGLRRCLVVALGSAHGCGREPRPTY